MSRLNKKDLDLIRCQLDLGVSVRVVAEEFSVGTSTLYDFMAKLTHKEYWQEFAMDALEEEQSEPKEIVGIIGDTHIPFVKEGYMEFCLKVFKDAGVTKVVHIGDLIDHHALSFHDSEPTLQSGYDEARAARDVLKPWFEAFPDMILVDGNHDLIPARQIKKAGLDPETWLKSLQDVYGMPQGWKTVDEVWIDGVLYHHGYTAMGVNGFRNDSRKRMCNTVSGHCHSNAGISASASDCKLVWGMAVGCGIDNTSMAMAYGKNFLSKPIVSCGVVAYGQPSIHYMDLGSNK